MKKIFIPLFFISAVTFCNAQITSYGVGDVVPDFTGIEPDGTEHNLYSYTAEGKYVLIDFFAYWCGPCMATAPKVQEFYEKYGCNSGNIIVIGNECDPAGTNALLESFDLSAGLDPETAFPSWSGMEGGGADIGNMYSPAAYPTVILVGPDNKLINLDIWPIPDISAIENAFPAGILVEQECGATTTDINEQLQKDLALRIAPNPVVETLNLSWSKELNGELTFNVINVQGVMVHAQTVNSGGLTNQTVNLPQGLPSGFYTVEIISSGQQVARANFQLIK